MQTSYLFLFFFLFSSFFFKLDVIFTQGVKSFDKEWQRGSLQDLFSIRGFKIPYKQNSIIFSISNPNTTTKETYTFSINHIHHSLSVFAFIFLSMEALMVGMFLQVKKSENSMSFLFILFF